MQGPKLDRPMKPEEIDALTRFMEARKLLSSILRRFDRVCHAR